MTREVNKYDNQGPELDPFDDIKGVINGLFDTAKDFCDGEAIGSQQMHDAVEKIHDELHAAGKDAEKLRKAEKKPHDDAGNAVQAKFKPSLTAVVLGKATCQSILAPWRIKVAKEKAEAAERQRVAAEAAAAEAEKAIQASSGNLEARIEAEELLDHSKSLTKGAKSANKDATTGTGLRTIWHTKITDTNKALDWAFEKDKQAFLDLATSMAKSAVHGGLRDISGFEIVSEQVAR